MARSWYNRLKNREKKEQKRLRKENKGGNKMDISRWSPVGGQQWQRPAATGGWKVKGGDDNSTICSLIGKPNIYFEPKVKQKIELMMEAYPHLEWLAYLLGDKMESKDFCITDMVVPPHETATGGSAEAVPFNIPEGCIGIIHSHHTMGAFHSGTDKDYVDKNFKVSIVVAGKPDDLTYNAVSHQVTECCKGTTAECPVKDIQPPLEFDAGKFTEEATKNVDKGKTVYTTPTWNQTQYHRTYGIQDTKEPGYKAGGLGSVMSQKEIDAATVFLD